MSSTEAAWARMLPGFVRELGGMVELIFLLIVRGVRAPYSWGAEFAEQFVFTLRLCLFPLLLSAFALSFGPMGVQASGFFQQFGDFDRLGSVYGLVEGREVAPLVVGVVPAGAAGTAGG